VSLIKESTTVHTYAPRAVLKGLSNPTSNM